MGLSLFVALPDAAAHSGSVTRFHGRTDQGFKIELGTKERVPDYIYFSKFRVPCQEEAAYVEPDLYFDRLDIATPKRLVESGGYDLPGYLRHASYRIVASHNIGGWAGSLRVQASTDAGNKCRADIAFFAARPS